MLRKLPAAQNRAVAVQEFDKEILIYDFDINKAYCLNETSSVVYRHCDGKTSFDELNRRYNYTDDLIYFALEELQKSNLVEGEKIAHFAGLTRREAVKRVGLGTLAALPVISALAAPSAAQAASGCAADGQTCTFNNFTQSNCCAGGRCQSSNACVQCFPQGVRYSGCAAPGSTPENQAACATVCNNDPRKNLCCNGGTATANFDTTANPPEYACLCPSGVAV